MKRISIFSLLLAAVFPLATFADEEPDKSKRVTERQARELAQEVLTGRQVRVRVYNDCKKDPIEYKLVSVELDGLSFQCDAVEEAFGKMSESAVIVVAGEDQTDEAVTAVLEDFIYVETYKNKKGGSLSIWPKTYNREQSRKPCVFKDSLRDPIPNATVEIWMGIEQFSDRGPRVLIAKAKLDGKGLLQPPRFISSWHPSFIVYHPDCGLANARYTPDFSPNEPYRSFLVPALPKDKWCVFTDALGNPIPNATVEIFVGGGWEEGRSKPLGKAKLDEKGRLKPPRSFSRPELCYFILSHPDYGTALVEPRRHIPLDKLLTTCTVPLVRIGTKADERSIWGAIVDSNDNPVAEALIECQMVSTPGRGRILLPYHIRYRAITDEQGRFSMYLPIEKDSDKHGNLVPLASKYLVSIESPKALGLKNYFGEINSGEETTITMLPAGHGGYFHTFLFEDANGLIVDPNRLGKIEIAVKHDRGLKSFQYNRWKDGGKFPLGTYQARALGPGGLRFEAIEVAPDSPELLVFKVQDEIIYYGKVIHGITGEPIPDAIVMKRPIPSDISTPSLESPESDPVRDILLVGPELDLDDSIFGLLKENFKSTMMTRTDTNGDFQITLPKEDRLSDSIIAVQKDYLGAQQDLKYMVPIDKNSPEPIKFREFEPDASGYVKLPSMKLFPAGTIFIEPNIPDFERWKRYDIKLQWRPSPKDKTPWLKDISATPRDNKGGSVFYKSMLRPNQAQSVYILAGVELTIKIYQLRENPRAPVVITGVTLQQGQSLDLGRIDFPPTFKVAVKLIDSSGEPVGGVAISCTDEDGLFWGQKAITDENGIVMLYVPPHSKGRFIVDYFDISARKNIREGTVYKVAGEEDTGKQFTLQLSDEMLYHLFK